MCYTYLCVVETLKLKCFQLSVLLIPDRDEHSYGVVMNGAGPRNTHPVEVNTRPATIKNRGTFCDYCKCVSRKGDQGLIVCY